MMTIQHFEDVADEMVAILENMAPCLQDALIIKKDRLKITFYVRSARDVLDCKFLCEWGHHQGGYRINIEFGDCAKTLNENIVKELMCLSDVLQTRYLDLVDGLIADEATVNRISYKFFDEYFTQDREEVEYKEQLMRLADTLWKSKRAA
ncbi:hypothetical protein [Sulfitobacter sp. M22]|uniref:hypothetical protein n=1 Tax=Sulfitobacter sp. M22 TaxID=2675332 RepID=UPI001F2A2E4E|nr:hypothetical protein [Sulfitobacter sp. M22]MCF7728687.1 hypothetical protein [Sulfitobacter sp. M22]